MGGRISKPSVNSISDWVGTRLTKFVSGDGDSPTPPEDDVAATDKLYVRTFSHYSEISSASPSTSPSPAPSFVAMNNTPVIQPPRTSSAASTKPIVTSHTQLDRSSSAMEYYRPPAQRSSPAPRIASASASVHSFSQVPSFGQALSSYGIASQSESTAQQVTEPQDGSTAGDPDESGDSTWWGSSYGESNRSTPTAATFFRVDSNVDSSGFVSLMDDPALLPISPSKVDTQYSPIDDVEDLGLGNPSSKNLKKVPEEDVSDTSSTRPTDSKQGAAAEPPKRPGQYI